MRTSTGYILSLCLSFTLISALPINAAEETLLPSDDFVSLPQEDSLMAPEIDPVPQNEGNEAVPQEEELPALNEKDFVPSMEQEQPKE